MALPDKFVLIENEHHNNEVTSKELDVILKT